MAAAYFDPAELQRAIDIYMKLAYPGEPPFVVRAQLSTLRAWKGELSECRIFVPFPPTAPFRYTLRLGNAAYPHMKLSLEFSGDRKQILYLTETHDSHVCPAPNSPEYPAFRDLMANNQKLAAAIESAWEAAGIPTFKAYLRQDLQRRQAAAESQTAR